MLPLISIQILNWNRAEETQRAISSAINQSYPNIEIVVIDNGSTDNSVQLTKKNFPNIKVIELGANFGCPGGRNLGIDHCAGQYIFYLDNDGVLHNRAVENAYNTIVSDNKVGIVTGVVYDFKSPTEIDPSCRIINEKSYHYNNFQGGICLHDKRIYDKTGLYPQHFMYGAEESYMSFRLFDAGFQLIKDESVVLWHKQSEFARDRSKELTTGYFNKLYVAVSLFPFFYALLFVLYFVPKYSLYAYRQNFLRYFLKGYIKRFRHTVLLGIKERKPVKLSTFLMMKHFKPTQVVPNSED